MTNKRFSKNQIVYQASDRFSSKDYRRPDGRYVTVIICRVIERVVDACGNKQVTFYNRGNDSIFGRSHCANAAYIQPTAQQAFDYLEARKANYKPQNNPYYEARILVIDPVIMTDAVVDWDHKGIELMKNEAFANWERNNN